MNRIAPIFALMLLFAVGEANGQGNLYLGLKGMPQNTWLLNQADSDSGDVAYVSTFNAAYGLSIGYQWDRGIGLQLDVLYSQQGQTKEEKFFGQTFDVETELTYLKLPLLFTFTSDPMKKSMFYGNIGPQVSLLQSSDVINDGNSLNDVANGGGETLDTDDLFNSMDIGVVFGIGGRFRLGESLFLNTGVRLDYGLTDAENKDFEVFGSSFYADDRPSTSNATAAFEIGLSYVLGEKLSD